MSADEQGGAGGREVAYRVFAAEYDDADLSYSESDEERAPNYVVLPTGARVNRVFAVGVLTEVEAASDDILRARVVDPTGAFVVYAGQYQPDATAFLERADPPTFVAVTGKARTFQPDDSDVTYTSIRPETITEVDAETRDRWTVQCARQTIDRVETTARALTYDERGDELRRRLESEGVDVGLAAGIPLALDHYDTTGTYLDAVRTLATQAAEVVAGERDEVDPFTADPDERGSVDPSSLAAQSGPEVAGVTTPTETTESTAESEPTTPSEASEAAKTAEATGTTEPTEPEPTESSGETTEATEPTDGAGTAETATETEPAAEPAGTESGESTSATADSSGGERSASAAESDEATVAGGDEEPTAVGSDEETAVGTESDGAAGTAGESDELEDFEPGEFDLDEDEREEIEEEFGTEFQTGTEVEEPGEADIETPSPEELSEATESGESSVETTETAEETTETVEKSAEGAAVTTEESTGSADETTEAAEEPAETPPPAEDVDLEDAVMDAMREGDAGDGASEGDIVDSVVDRYGVAADDVREAIQDALMDGRCYEPEDDVYKPI